jgi:hypothetical protein
MDVKYKPAIFSYPKRRLAIIIRINHTVCLINRKNSSCHATFGWEIASVITGNIQKLR